MSINDVFDHVLEAADGDNVSIEDLLEAFGRRAYGPILFVVGLVSLSPVGAIPGASILIGTVVILLMAQYIVRDAAPWLPGWVVNRKVGADGVRQAVDRLRPYVLWMGTVIKPRLTVFAEPPWIYLAAAVAIMMAATMYPLALVPWGVLPPSLAIVLLGLGMMSSDGLVMLVGIVVGVVSVVAGGWLLA